MFDKLKSRKFWFALVGAVLPIVAQAFTAEIDLQTAVQMSSAIVVGYIFGQSYVDGKALEGTVPVEEVVE